MDNNKNRLWKSQKTRINKKNNVNVHHNICTYIQTSISEASLTCKESNIPITIVFSTSALNNDFSIQKAYRLRGKRIIISHTNTHSSRRHDTAVNKACDHHISGKF